MPTTTHLPYPPEELHRQGPQRSFSGRALGERSRFRSAASAPAPFRAGAASCAIGRFLTGPARA